MIEELQEKLNQRFPEFLTGPEGKGIRFDCYDGWFELLWDLCVALEPLISREDEKEGSFHVIQVKEKDGILCFYMSASTPEMDALIDAAVEKSAVTCEICGDPGKLDDGVWKSTMCENHLEI